MIKLRAISFPDRLILLFLATIAVILFFYRLGWGSLAAWDEAWYGEIGRNTTHGHWLFLESHYQLFVDHPPLGYWLIGLSQLTLGESSFSVRAPMALLGVATILLIYLTGAKLGNRWTGLMAAIVLLTSRWFVLRVRTGNLDSLLVFTQLLIFYLAYRAKNRKDLCWLFAALSVSLLTKSLISLTLIPIVFWASYQVLLNSKLSKTMSVAKTLVFFLICLLPLIAWYGLMYWQLGPGLFERLTQVVLRGETSFSLNQINPLTTLNLIQALIHRWFKPLIASLVISVLFIRNRSSRWVLVYLACVSWPYFLSTQTKIWHLLPLTPVIALLISLALTQVQDLISKIGPNYFSKSSKVLVLVGLICYASLTLWEIKSEIIPATNQASDQEVLGRAISNLPGVVYLDVFEDMGPAVLYYANRPTYITHTESRTIDLRLEPRPFSLLTTRANPGIDACRLVKTSREFAAYHCQ